MTARPKQVRRETRVVNGVLLLNKPAGLSSNQALQKVKRLFKAKKAGHTGSLDPAATGMLPLCFGEATKICAYLLDADKSYRVTAKLGSATDTGDADGTVISTAAVPEMSAADWEGVLQGFIGDLEQIPPMYSALKQNGKRLYELARKGEIVERKARAIKISDIVLLEATPNRLVFRVGCSKGTYVRTLVEDIAKSAGTLAHTAHLYRETVGDFRPENMLDMAQLEALAEQGDAALDANLLPPDQALSGWPEQEIDPEATRRFLEGQQVLVGADKSNGHVRVYGSDAQFLGVGEFTSEGSLAPRRIFRMVG